MKRFFVLTLIIGFLFSVQNFCYGQNEEALERLLVLREGKQFKKNSVAVEVFLKGDILEVLVEARMYAQTPRINDVMLKGPKLGRLHYKTRNTILAGLEEQEPLPITDEEGLFFVFGKRKKEEKPEGTLTRELFQIKIPRDKIIQGKRYELWVEIESKTNGGSPERFKFNLKDLSESISK